jgi:NitT/TauT family transport system ATP-binding protein
MSLAQLVVPEAGQSLHIAPAQPRHNSNAALANVISLRAVELSFQTRKGPRLVALSNIQLEIQTGEFLCIVGPSGCGKSSLLSLIAGLSFPTGGEVHVNDRVVTGPGTDRILIFQEHGLFPWLTVGQNVEFGMKMMGLGRRERRERAEQYLQLVHLHGFRDSYIHQLSGGMRQRVAIARALATRPSVLLMDEPFAALDAQTRDMLHDELERIWKETGCTIIFVTHNVREAVRLGSRVILMTYRPGTIRSQLDVDLPRPRRMDDPRVATFAREILDELREEINKAVASEYDHVSHT